MLEGALWVVVGDDWVPPVGAAFPPVAGDDPLPPVGAAVGLVAGDDWLPLLGAALALVVGDAWIPLVVGVFCVVDLAIVAVLALPDVQVVRFQYCPLGQACCFEPAWAWDVVCA